MRKLLNKPWFVASIAAVAVLLAAQSLWSGKPLPLARGAVDTQPLPGGEASEALAANDTAKLPAREALRALPPVVISRDPFALRSRGEESEGEKRVEPDLVDRMHLSAIWSQDRTILVLINDRICQIGDVIGRLKIESITNEGVWITHWKGRDFLTLGADFTLTTPVKTARLNGLPL